jgi:hypothetical protein
MMLLFAIHQKLPTFSFRFFSEGTTNKLKQCNLETFPLGCVGRVMRVRSNFSADNTVEKQRM